MSDYHDIIVFIDRHETKIFHISAEHDLKLVLTHSGAKRRHHRSDHEDGTKRAVDDDYLHAIVGSLDPASNTLICGPGNSKYELQAYMQQHRPDLASRISGVETLDDTKDSSILAIGRQIFGNRAHRHQIVAQASSRHLDVPFKSG